MNRAALRETRRHEDDPVHAPRTEFERDRDRVLHSTALRRLGSITQVVSAAEGHVFHNRLTHVLKVAQIARGIAEELLASKESKELAQQLGGLNAHVAETAALAHDLGHPPFGHIAEHRLDTLLKEHQVLDGFEGNAQSFRIVTKLAIRSDDCDGLNLTAASLVALLKYPWFRQTDNKKREHKWGAYHEEEADFKFARKCFAGPASERRSVEAEVMDWADDIAYSIYDLEDFYRAGMIPLERIFPPPPNDLKADPPPLTDDAEEFLVRGFKRWAGEPDGSLDEKEYRETFQNMTELLEFPGRYEGSKSQRAALRRMTSTLIRRYIGSIELNPQALTSKGQPVVKRNPKAEREVKLLKEFTWQYVIINPALARIQHGQCSIIESLFNTFMEAAESSKGWKLFPKPTQELLDEAKANGNSPLHARIVADFISGLTEHQAIELHQRLTGATMGSVLYSSV